MARRNITTFLISMTVAVMVGIREATGLAPPPPTLGSEEVVWLSPERDGDPGIFVVLEDPEPQTTEPLVRSPQQPRVSLLARVFGRLGRGASRR